MPARPAAVAFDVIGTLFPLEPLRPAGDLGLPPQALEIWFARTLRDGFALAAVGTYRPFVEVATGTLEGLLGPRGRPEESSRISEVLSHFFRLPSRPDAGQAMTRLRSAGVRVLALTNGSERNTRSLLKGSGLGDHVERIISIDDPGAWKPRAELYEYALRETGLALARWPSPRHAWDCHGAARRRLVTGWVSRPEMRFHPAFGRPDVQGETLAQVAKAMLGLRES